MENTGRKSSERNEWIDCLRGLSILVVMASHGVMPVMSLLPRPGHLSSISSNGCLGVSVFFVISGFLITSNALRRYDRLPKIDFGQFYAMRVARILPPLLLFIAVMLGLALLKAPDFTPPSWAKFTTAVYKALTLQYNSHCLHGGAVPGLEAWRVLWSLSIEELFYLFFPIACFLTRRKIVFVGLLLIMITDGPLARRTLMDLYGWWGAADQLSTGCLAAILVAQIRQGHLRVNAWWSIACLTVGTAMLAYGFAFTNISTAYRWVPSLIGIGAALLVFGAAFGPRAVPLTLRPFTAVLAAFGRASYEIYIFHSALRIGLGGKVTQLVARRWPQPVGNAIGVTIVLVALIFLLATGTAKFFSEPINRSIRRFYRTPPQSPEPLPIPTSA